MALLNFDTPCLTRTACELVLSEAKEVRPFLYSFLSLVSIDRVERSQGNLMSDWYLYITDKKGKLYVGVTTDLESRMRQHGVTGPLYFESLMSRAEALKRERTLKGWRKEKKLALIDKASSQQK